MCFAGDQGFQLNVQELQFISMHRLPIVVVLLNNGASGMIRDKERNGYGKYLHVTADSGFGSPCMPRLAESYGIDYMDMSDLTDEMLSNALTSRSTPLLLNCSIDVDLALAPVLPRNRLCQDLLPEMPSERFRHLNDL